MALIECIPNISEGRRAAIVEELATTIRSVQGVKLLDYSADPSHNRSVFTFAGETAPLQEAILHLYAKALDVIDLRTHIGEHPRIGVVDVIPFVPLEDGQMTDCVMATKQIASVVEKRFAVPVYLYGHAASTDSRKNLEDIRRGGFEKLTTKMAESAWAPDYGKSSPHPTAGASAFGARGPLIAYNINLATNQLAVAKKIAVAVRSSSGGLSHVKAMGVRLSERDLVQVSMNLTNYRQTSIVHVFDAVSQEAAKHGVAILESEIIGLIPSDALWDVNAHDLQLRNSVTNQILETKLMATK